MTLRRGSKVWVEDKDSAWVAAEVVDFLGKQVQLLTVSGKKVLAVAEKLLPRDAESDLGGVDDMTKLTYLNEPGVLDNLQRRYALNEIYEIMGSREGNVNIEDFSLNITALKTIKLIKSPGLQTYTGSILIAVNPFTKLPHLYNMYMMEQYKGAPFGELSPHVFAVADASYRAMMSEGCSQSILVSGESGAGKTETTKLIMQYLTYVGGRAAGDDRTVEQQVLESNPLLEAFGNARTVRNDNSSRFGKFVEIQFDSNGRISGAAIRTYLLERSRVVQITDPERNYHCFYQLCASGTEAIFRTLAGILHLGNVEFSPGREHDSSVIKDQKSNFHLQMAANLFRCDVNLLLATLTTRSIQTYEGIIVKALDCNAAVAGRDALAKTVYARLFDCFEQFCINFANEKLQQHFNEKPIGIIALLDEAWYTQNSMLSFSYLALVYLLIVTYDPLCSMFPKSTHETFSNKLFQNFRAHPRLEKAKFSETDFTISHYAGKVNYQTETFLDKNRDYVVVEHCNLLASSRCPFISGLFPPLPEESSRSSYKFSSVASRFKGVLEAVRISLAGYPTRKTYHEFVDRFGIIALDIMDGSYDDKTMTEKILQRLKLGNFQLGKTKVFLRAGQIAILDSRRAEVLDSAAKRIQGRLRTYLARRDYVTMRVAAISLQACCRGYLARNKFVEMRETAAAIVIQKYLRGWFFRHAYMQLRLASVLIQSSVRGFSTRRKFLYRKEDRAATLIQARWRMFKIRSIYRNRQSKIIAIQCLWRQKLAKRELRRLKKVSNEEAKLVEISKLQKTVESLTLELEAAKLATLNEFNKNMVLERQLELSAKEKSALERDVVSLTELRNENALLKRKTPCWRLAQTKEDASSTIAKLQQVEKSCLQLQMSLRSMEEKLSNLEAENHILRQKTLNVSPRSNRAGFVKPLLDKFSGALVLSSADQKSYGNLEILSRCIKENLGFKDGKPVAACVIYKCLLHWHAFESERTAMFDFIIESINDVLKGPKSSFKYLGLEDGLSHMEAKYPALLFKQQLTACVEKIFGLIRDNLKKEISPLLDNAYRCILKVLTILMNSPHARFENTIINAFTVDLNNLFLVEKAPRNQRVHGGKSSRSPGGVSQQSPSSEWDSILKFLDSLMSRLRGNHVPSFFIRKLTTQVFAFINIQLFNSLLLRRECCSFSNGEYVKSGLAELEKWIVNATEEFAGTSWHELNYIRQAVGFLVIHQKRKKSLEEIRQDLCPKLTVRQIYRISTMYWDDKYGTQSVSNEVVSQMREIVNKDSQNLSSSNSFLLDDDLSIPFSTEDVYMAIPALNPSDVELPQFFSEYPSAQLLLQDQNLNPSYRSVLLTWSVELINLVLKMESHKVGRQLFCCFHFGQLNEGMQGELGHLQVEIGNQDDEKFHAGIERSACNLNLAAAHHS
ncbi:UNVERIFIED_CONTAM: protein OPAQUE1 [Sesamum radiatum]|uniref:Protein OPAQUE1 n=1 Tax=Sesamum radiatum TaxID=300843 RepID=A0AAW2KZ65_SESRA